MERLHSVLTKHSSNYYNLMIWAACCTAYFGLLRVSESTTSSPNHFNASTDLLLSDIALDRTSGDQDPTETETDQYKKGRHVYVGKKPVIKYAQSKH